MNIFMRVFLRDIIKKVNTDNIPRLCKDGNDIDRVTMY